MDGKRADKRVNDMEEDRRRGPLVEVAGCGRFYWYSRGLITQSQNLLMHSISSDWKCAAPFRWPLKMFSYVGAKQSWRQVSDFKRAYFVL